MQGLHPFCYHFFRSFIFVCVCVWVEVRHVSSHEMSKVHTGWVSSEMSSVKPRKKAQNKDDFLSFDTLANLLSTWISDGFVSFFSI